MRSDTSPRIVTSKRTIKYRESRWKIHRFEVWSGDLVCRTVAIKMKDSLFLWVGGAGEPALGAAALGLPAARAAERALGAALLAGGGEPGALARRVAAALRCPALVCSALALDRFSAPLVERGLAMEIKARPHCFYSPMSSENESDMPACATSQEDQQMCAKSQSCLLKMSGGNQKMS